MTGKESTMAEPFMCGRLMKRCGRTLLLAAAILLTVCWIGCRKSENDPAKNETRSTAKNKTGGVDVAAIAPKVKAFCGDCHAVPKPAMFPKRAWYDEVAQGYRFYDESRRSDLDPPPMNDVVAYYRQLAPESLTAPKPVNAASPAAVQFDRRDLRVPHNDDKLGVSHLLWTEGPSALLLCDMAVGEVREVRLTPTGASSRVVARLSHPAHVERVDLDGDGRGDLLIAELGSFNPADHTKGEVVWLRAKSDGDGYEKHVLKSGLGRVADVRPADFDGDGKLDLIVAEFGWRTTGRILLLKHVGQEAGIPRYETIVVDRRHGTIHVPVVDLNRDGRPDFIALISQEHEVVEAFVNTGNGTFEKKRIFDGGDPSFGSSGIQVVDLDGDGDFDVLYTNGDSLDSENLKPFHSIRWLENRGAFPFADRELTRMPGVARALATDLDGDGDLDIVACAFLPESIARHLPGRQYDTLLWLEQTRKGDFARHLLDHSETGHLALAVGDFDRDGSTDLALGNYGRRRNESTPWLTIWRTRPTKIPSSRHQKRSR